MMRLALFGGTFDPVHRGHLLMAQAACEEQQLERIIFIPAAQSPFKPDQKPTPPQIRLQLLRLALAGKANFEIDDQEIKRGGFSFTVDTVQGYRERFPDAKIFYLIGADHVAQLPKWRDAGRLATLAEFLVIPRPGETPQALPSPFRGRALHGFPLGVSSSQIRARVRQGLPIHELVPAAVAQAIAYNRLYL